MHFAVIKKTPIPNDDEFPVLKRGGKRVILIFVLTLLITIFSNIFLEMPAIAGMMLGLAILQFFAYYLTTTEKRGCADTHKGFDIFKCIAAVDWDTLLFFYGAMMIVGALNFLGYMDTMAEFLFGRISPTIANILIGLSSAFVDNGTLMFAVLNMRPEFPNGQWLLLTLTLGVGGSLLAIGSAPGLNVLGLMKGVLKEGEGYTFSFHLRWMPAVLLGFIASIFSLYLVNGGHF